MGGTKRQLVPGKCPDFVYLPSGAGDRYASIAYVFRAGFSLDGESIAIQFAHGSAIDPSGFAAKPTFDCPRQIVSVQMLCRS